MSGSGWLRARLPYLAKRGQPPPALSEFGARVADLLGELFDGLYHWDGAERTDWSREHVVEVTVAKSSSLATYDFDHLTRLVFLAHRDCIRVEIEPASPKYLRVVFTPRKRDGGWIAERHPTLREAVEAFEREYVR